MRRLSSSVTATGYSLQQVPQTWQSQFCKTVKWRTGSGMSGSVMRGGWFAVEAASFQLAGVWPGLRYSEAPACQTGASEYLSPGHTANASISLTLSIVMPPVSPPQGLVGQN